MIILKKIGKSLIFTAVGGLFGFALGFMIRLKFSNKCNYD